MLRFRMLVSLVVAVLLLSACQPVTAEPGSQQNGEPSPQGAMTSPSSSAEVTALPELGAIQIAYVPVLAATPLFLAVEQGYFAEQDLQVELQRVRNSDEMLAPLGTGKIDFTNPAVTTGFFNAMQQELDIRMVAGAAGWQAPEYSASVLMVSKPLVDSGEVSSIADLKGRKIAINLRGSTLEYVLARGLEQAGLTMNDVELVPIPGPEMQVALANAAVDAAMVGSLNALPMIRNEVAVQLLADFDILPSGQGTVLVFGQRMLQPENREVAIRLLVAYFKAVNDLLARGWDDPAIVSVIEKYTEIAPAAIMASPKPFLSADGAINTASILDTQAFQIAGGYVAYQEPLAIEQMIEESILAEAMARLAQE